MSGFSTARQKMVDGPGAHQRRPDSRIIDAMLEVPREAFVPDNKQALAYLDSISMSAPRVRPALPDQARGDRKAAAGGRDQAHRQGFGGRRGVRYVAALAAKLAGQVTATESDPWLAAEAGSVLTQIGCGNVTVKTRCGRRR